MSDDSRVTLDDLRLRANAWLDAVIRGDDVAPKYFAIVQHTELLHDAESREFFREHIIRQSDALERIAAALEAKAAAQ